MTGWVDLSTLGKKPTPVSRMRMQDRGECFAVAINLATELQARNLKPLICHGTPIGVGTKNLGVRFWHAWVELLTERYPLVMDYSGEDNLEIRRTTYYRLGQIDGDKHVWRFNFDDAHKAVDKYGTTGPWVDDADDLGIFADPVDA